MSSEASRNETEPVVCSICLSSPVTKIVGTCGHAFCTTCRHAFCTTCLSKYLNDGQDSKTFLCPTCKVEYPVPASGASGLVDCSQDGQAVVKPEALGKGCRQEEHLKCLSCFHTTKDSVQARNLCVDCGDMVMCDDCTQVHQENEVTKDHIIIPLDWSRMTEEVQCEAHALLAKDYCSTCSKQVCHLCVHFEHGKHMVRKLVEVFFEMTQEVETITEENKTRSIRLRHVGDELKVLKASALDTRDAMVKEIEDEAEKRIEEILKQKEELKKQVRNEFSFVDEVVTCLDKIPGLVERLVETVADAERFLAEPARYIARLEKIASLRDSMISYGQLAGQIHEENLWDNYESHRQTGFHFVPNTEEFRIGKISLQRTHDFKQCSLVHEHVFEVHVDDQTDSIPCVTIVGSKYAVAHPTSADRPSAAFDVYAFPGTYERTITEHVAPLYDMTRTPDGKVAILSDGSSPEDSCSVRIFDTDEGYERSSSDIELKGHIAFDVNMFGHYVILSKEEEYMVTVARDDGKAVLQHTLDKDKHGLEDPSRITAVGRCYFIMARNGVAVYRHKNGKMSYITNYLTLKSIIHDISGSIRNGVTVVFHSVASSGGRRFGRTSLGNDNKMSTFDCSLEHLPHATNKVSRLSVSGNHIVESYHQAVRVYNEKY